MQIASGLCILEFINNFVELQKAHAVWPYYIQWKFSISTFVKYSRLTQI